jgi:GntR family transcriptional regulator
MGALTRPTKPSGVFPATGTTTTAVDGRVRRSAERVSESAKHRFGQVKPLVETHSYRPQIGLTAALLTRARHETAGQDASAMNRTRPDLRSRRRLDASRQLRDLLRVGICHDTYPDGVLPSESEIMLGYSVSRSIAREALALLRDEGLINRVQGTGTFALARKVPHRFDHIHGVDPPDSLERGAGVVNRFLSITTVAAPPPVAARLDLTAGSRCLRAEYLTSLGGTPYSVSTSYLVMEHAGALERGDFSVDWYWLLESGGLRLGVCEQAVEAIIADDLVADLLQVAPGAPLLLFERLIRDHEERPIDYGFVRVRGDRIALLISLPRQTKEPG